MNRERLPDRRGHEVVEIIHGRFLYTFGVGRYADGRPAEIFVDAGKSGTDAQVIARDGVIVLSLLLQHGCSLATIQHALSREEDGAAQGPLGLLVDALAAEDAPAAAPEPEPENIAAEATP